MAEHSSSYNIMVLAVPYIAFMAGLIIQIIISRYVFRGQLLRSLILGLICSGILLIPLELGARDFDISEFSGNMIVDFILLISLFWGYQGFVTLGLTSLRIKIMQDILGNNGNLTLEKIRETYNAEQIREKRLRRLLSSGQISNVNNRLFISSNSVLVMSKIIYSLKKFLIGESATKLWDMKLSCDEGEKSS